MTSGQHKRKMAHAGMMMANAGKYKVHSRLYESIRTAKRMEGLSDKHKEKISIALKGRNLKPMTEETKAKLRAKIVTDETKKKISDAAKRRTRNKHSVATRQTMSEAASGKPAIMETCFSCGVITNVGNIKRWHNENCRNKAIWFCAKGHDQSIHRVTYSGNSRCGPCHKQYKKKKN